MKRTIYYFLCGLAGVSGAGACTSESIAPQPEFYVRANKNGASWIVPGEATFDSKRAEFFVFGQQVDQNATLSILRLSFAVPSRQPLATAIQVPATVPSMPATWITLVGGDVITDSYTQDSLPATSLRITRLDTVQKVVEGTFDATLTRDARWLLETETLRFTEGSFRVRYQQFR